MAGLNDEIKLNTCELDANSQVEVNQNGGLPVKAGFWSRMKAFWLQEIDWNQEIKVELTPYQQKIEDEINEFLHQEVTFKSIKNFLFKEIKF